MATVTTFVGSDIPITSNPVAHNVSTIISQTATVFSFVSQFGDLYTFQGSGFTYPVGFDFPETGTVDTIEIDLSDDRTLDILIDYETTPEPVHFHLLPGVYAAFTWESWLTNADTLTLEGTMDTSTDVSLILSDDNLYTTAIDGFAMDGSLAQTSDDVATINAGGVFYGDGGQFYYPSDDTITIARTMGQDIVVVGESMRTGDVSNSVSAVNDTIIDQSTNAGETTLIGDIILFDFNGQSASDPQMGNDILTASADFAATIVGDVYYYQYINLDQSMIGGDDIITGSDHDDVLVGDVYDITIDTDGANQNELTAGDDDITGGMGDDMIYGDYVVYSDQDVSGGDDVLRGGDGDDHIFGQTGNDTLRGGDGDDFLEGGSGDDNLDGGLGFDTASFAGATGAIALSLVNTGSSTATGFGTDTLQDIESMIGSDFDDVLQGNATINTIEGGAGDDMLNGRGNNKDVISYAGAEAGITFSLLGQGVAQDTGGAGIDTVINFEYVTGSGHDDVIIGDTGRNLLRGADGDDVLEGRNGNDKLLGGGGDDRMVGGGGLDFFNGGRGIDTIDMMAFSKDVVVDLTAQSLTHSFVETFVNVEDFETGSGDDTLVVADNDQYSMDAGDGIDTLDMSAVTYAITIEATNGSSLQDGFADVIVDGALFTITYKDFEVFKLGSGDDVTLSIQSDVTIYGGDGDDILSANSGINELHGDAGDDILTGGADKDTFFAGNNNDTVNGGDGGDTLNGGNGIDMLYGEEGGDTLKGGNGDDTMEGGAGSDTLLGGADDDTMFGGDQGDDLQGEDGNDTLDGGSNGDTLNGGADNDTLTGGLGNDQFIFDEGFGQDTITDFDALANGEDIDLSNVAAIVDFADLEANHMDQVGADVVIDDLAGNTITLLDIDIADLANGDFVF